MGSVASSLVRRFCCKAMFLSTVPPPAAQDESGHKVESDVPIVEEPKVVSPPADDTPVLTGQSGLHDDGRESTMATAAAAVDEEEEEAAADARGTDMDEGFGAANDHRSLEVHEEAPASPEVLTKRCCLSVDLLVVYFFSAGSWWPPIEVVDV